MSDVEPKSSDQILEELFKSLASQPCTAQVTADEKTERKGDEVGKDDHESKSKGKKGKKKKKRKGNDSDDEERSRKRKKHDKTKKTNESEVKEKKKKDKKRERSVSKEKEADKPKKLAKVTEAPKKEEPRTKEQPAADRERHEDQRDKRRSLEKERPSARERDRHGDRSTRENGRKRSDSRRRRSRSRNRSRSRSPVNRRRARRSRSPYRRRRSRSRSQRRRRSRSTSNHRRSGNERSRSPVVQSAPARNRSPHIDKAQLLQAARENLKRMQESGILPSSLSALVANSSQTSSKPVGKTVEEFTDYCKNLIRQGSEDDGEADSKAKAEPSAEAADGSTTFTRHPFQIKPRNDTAIVMNIRNAIPIPVRKPEERIAAQAQLKQQFPVSSGQQHLSLEWVPVSPKKEEDAKPKSKKSVAIEGTKQVNMATVAPIPRQPTEPESAANMDISEIVSRRLAAIRKLQDNKEDEKARLELEQAEMMSRSWANQTSQQRNTNPITGEPLPELIDWSGAPQVWARKDQFTNAAPIFGGVGMKLLQKMGWQPGEGLGRNKEGTLEPLALDIKTDKKGLVSREEVAPKASANTAKLMQEFQGKHPVSILHELCTKRRWDPPLFEQVLDIGPDHQKHFLFKVIVNGVAYRPCVASTTKKEAKAQSAAACLQSLGILST